MRNKFIYSENYINVIITYLFTFILFVFFNFSFFDYSQEILFNLFLIILTQIFIFFLFGLDIISGVSFLTVFILWPSLLVFYSKTSKNLGLLTLHVIPIYMYSDTFYILLFILIWSFVAYVLQINVFEKYIIKEPFIKLNSISISFNNIVAILASIIAFPALPQIGTTVKESSFNGILPGHAWNQLAIVTLLFNMPYFNNKHKDVIICYFLVITWFILHGERADIAGLMLGVLILIFSSNRLSKLKKIFVIIVTLFIVILFISSKSDYSIFQSFNNLGTFSTVSDISYVFNSVIDYINNFGYTHGRTLLSMLKSAVPLIKDSHGVSYFLKEAYPYPGGASIVSGPLIDYGSIGIILYTILYTFIIRIILVLKSPFFKYEVLLLICSIPRISWYGINYVFMSMLFFIPFIYFVNKGLNDIKD